MSCAPPERARDFAPTVRSGRKGPFRSRPRRSPIGRLASGASASRSGPFRAGASAAGAKSRAVGAGAFGRSGGVRACRRAARPAWGAPRIRRMRAIRPRRNTAFAAWPRPGGADGRPAVREALGRASAPVPPLRARGTTFGFLYDAAARRLHLPCRPAAMRILCGINLKCCFLPLGSLFLRTLPNILRLDMRLSVERLSGPCARTG